MSDEAPPAKVEKGAPAWVMTFADLMSLLMCFFVLLLSFSEMDVSKYKEMAGSLKNAFGVQRDLKVKEPPKGINVIAREFSPGRPEPTHMNVIRQMTTNDLRINLDLGKERHRPVPATRDKVDPDQEKNPQPRKTADPMQGRQRSQADGLTESQKKELTEAKKLAAIRLEEKLKAEQQLANVQAQQKKGGSIDQKSLDELLKAKAEAEQRKKLNKNARLISSALDKEIKAGSVDVETAGQKIIIRVREKASFGSGSAELKDAFRPLLARVSSILKGAEGKIIVAGHTDNVPIYTERFRSNWELSSARAVSVAHEMMLATDIPSDRFLIQGFADTEPMAKNDTVANRARNRRVEIILQQGEDKQSKDRVITGKEPAAEKTKPADLQSQRQQRQTVAIPAPPASKKGQAAPPAKPQQLKASGIKIGGSRASTAREPAAAKPKVEVKPGLGIKAGGSDNK